MDWEYSFDREKNIMEVKVKGNLTKPEMDAMAKENLVEIRKFDCYKCLLNYFQTNASGSCELRVFPLPSKSPRSNAISPKQKSPASFTDTGLACV